MWAVVAMGSTGAALGAQTPQQKRARPQTHIPVRKEVIPLPVAAVPVVKGTNIEVVPPPVITTIVTPVPGTNTVIAQTAPGIGARPLPWLPLLGLLGGAALLTTRHHGEDVVQETTTPPEVVTPPVVVPPVVVPPVVVPPVTTVPEPVTLTMFATGFAGLALAMRRKLVP